MGNEEEKENECRRLLLVSTPGVFFSPLPFRHPSILESLPYWEDRLGRELESGFSPKFGRQLNSWWYRNWGRPR